MKNSRFGKEMMKSSTTILRFGLLFLLVTAIVSGLSLRLRQAEAQEKNESAVIQPGPVMVKEQYPAKIESDDSLSPESTTQTFSNTTSISIPGSGTSGNASPYPSEITVSGVNPAFTTKVVVQLKSLSHTYPDDLDIILVGPQGQRSMLMSDAGGGNDINAIDLRFDSVSTVILPDTNQLQTATFRPANYETETDNFPSPGPGDISALEPADLSVFNGTNPNGTWSLYVVDDTGQDSGMMAMGWSLTLTVPTVFTVTKTADTNDGLCNSDCSLREAITAAGALDLINFSSLFDTPQTINLTTPLPIISTNILILGKGANLLTVRRDHNAATNFSIFNIQGGITRVAISGMTITGGNPGSGFSGGGIYSESNLTLTGVHVIGNNSAGGGGGVVLGFADGVFNNCTFSNNSADGFGGGGIYYQGDGNHTLRVVNSTISGNSSVGRGGGILNASTNTNSRLEVVNSTIVGNFASMGGGIITNTLNNAGATATTTLRNTIVAGNSGNNLQAQTLNGGGAATFETFGFNLSDDYNGVFTPLATDITNANPRLGPLSLGGGTTPTHALLAASPALDAGNASGYTTDQRGVSRPSTNADIGAVEMNYLTVNNTANSGVGSLRDAITQANANPDLSDIIFNNSVFNTPQTITLTTGELFISSNLTINGIGANLLTISGNNQSRVFQVGPGSTASLSGITVTGGNADGDGGGIYNDGNLTVSYATVSGNLSLFNGGGIGNGANSILTVSNSTISGNTAVSGIGGVGGGINSLAGNTLTVTNSTISGNVAADSGGGIRFSQANVAIINSTITNNSANAAGRGVANFNGTVSIRNSIIAANVNNVNNPDVSAIGGAGIISQGYNLIGNRGGTIFNQPGDQSGTGASPLNPQLAPLALNGGTTPTHALLVGSPALDAGNNSGSGTLFDQRGLNRTVDLSGITNASDATDIGAYEAQTAPASPNQAPFDFDGDGKTDISIFRPSVGQWWYLKSSDSGNAAFNFGQSTDKITPGDFTGDGKADICFWRPSEGTWYVLRSEDSSFFSFQFGTNGDIPAPADYDGDGKTDPAVFRPSNQTWYINRSTAGFLFVTFGFAEDKPIPSDFDGDGKADIAIFRPSVGQWWYLRSSDGGNRAYQFGLSSDKPVPGDYTGDGKSDIAFWRPSDRSWYILRSEDDSFFSFPFGLTGDIPAPGDYDGDGKFDPTVFRPSSATWFVDRSTAGLLVVGFGFSEDRPVPSAFVP